jgi:hypothetical protein
MSKAQEEKDALKDKARLKKEAESFKDAAKEAIKAHDAEVAKANK